MNKLMPFCILVFLSACTGAGDEADAYGNFETDELTISSEAGGKVIRFHAREGQPLKAGDTAAVIDTVQLALRVRQVEASIHAINKKLPDEASQLAVYDERLAKINTEISRITALVNANAAPSKQLDDLRAELELTMKQKRAAASSLGVQSQGLLAEAEPLRYQLLQLKDQLQRSVVRNPIDGMVLTTLANENELASPGKPLYTIASMDPLILRAYVSEAMLGLVKTGDEVTVKTDAPDGSLTDHKGTVTWISSEAEFTPKMIQTRDERTTQVFAIKIEVPNDGSLKIGMPAEVYLDQEMSQSDD